MISKKYQINILNYLDIYLIVTLIFIICIILQIYNLDADPSLLKRWGDIADEGYWVHNARMKIIFGEFLSDNLNISYLGAPLYNLLVYISFNIGEVSLIYARSISIIFLLLTILLMFLTLNYYFTSKISIFLTSLFGMTHQLIIYGKFASPLILESFFLFMIFYLYKIKFLSKYNYFLIGLIFFLAITSKITSILFLPVVFFFFLYTYLSKQSSFMDVVIILIGFTIPFLLFFIFFVIPNLEYYEQMFEVSADAGKIHINSTLMKNILLSPLDMSFLKFPGTILIGIAVLFYFINKIMYFLGNKTISHLKKITDLEVFCLFWIIFICIALSLNDQIGLDRRMFQLLIPFFILFSFFVVDNNNQINFFEYKFLNILFCFISIVLISYYFSSMYVINIQQYFVSTQYIEKYNTFRHIPYFLILGIICTLLFYRHTNFLKRFLILLFVCSNLVLNIFNVSHASFTVKETSQFLKNNLVDNSYILGKHAHWYSVETKLKPIFININHQNGIYLKNKNVKYLIVDKNEEINLKMLDQLKIKKNNLNKINSFQISPTPFNLAQRENINLFEIKY